MSTQQDPDSTEQYTHFGNQRVRDTEKEALVKGVFDSVATRYDIMNDFMSLGLHRLWKRIAVELCALRPQQKILDVAAGSADLSAHFAKRVGPEGLVVVSDINAAMLQQGRDKLINQGFIKGVDFCLADAESLPFCSNYFDCVSIGFGLRNVTHIDKALASFYRVLKPGGRLIILEFSKPTQTWFQKIYDAYSFSILPKLGKYIANDEASYRYLAESIRKHPDQNTLKDLMTVAGFDDCSYHNLNLGVVAIHKGFKY